MRSTVCALAACWALIASSSADTRSISAWLMRAASSARWRLSSATLPVIARSCCSSAGTTFAKPSSAATIFWDSFWNPPDTVFWSWAMIFSS